MVIKQHGEQMTENCDSCEVSYPLELLWGAFQDNCFFVVCTDCGSRLTFDRRVPLAEQYLKALQEVPA